MFPFFSTHDVANSGSGNAVSCTNFALRSCSFKAPDFNYLVFGDFGRSSISALFGHVLAVVLHRTKEKMFRVYARWIVACVKNAKSIWNGSVVNHPRYSMCQSLFSGRPSFSKHTVSLLLLFAGPVPASLGDVSPKSMENGFGISLRDEKLKTINLIRHVAPSLKGSMCSSLHSGDNQLRADFFSGFTNHQRERQANAAVLSGK